MSAFIEINTSVAARDLETKLKSLYSGDQNKAINRAINRSLEMANAEANRQIRSVYNIALKDLTDKDNKLIKKSSESTLTGTINASIRPLSLSKFNPEWTRDRVAGNRSFLTKTKKNKTIKIKRGDVGLKIEILKGRKESIPSAFLLFKNGGTPVMARGVYGNDGFIFGSSRLPISKLNTKSVFYTLMNDDIQKALNQKITDVYPARLLQELEKGLKFNNP
jgi:hypothetical protein